MKATYITFNEPVNGVYNSQVIEVVKHLKSIGIDIRIIAFFSVRDFSKNRKHIKQQLPDSLAIPTIGRIRNWKLNSFWLKLLKWQLSKQTVVCRGALATNLAIDNLPDSKVIYDGRGAVWAEQQEYNVFEGTGIENEIFEIEKKAILNSHQQIAVSSELVKYWQQYFEFEKETYSIIPCTLSDHNISDPIEIPQQLHEFFKQNKNNIIITFSGGNGKWQQIDEICHFAEHQLKNSNNTAFLFLCPENQAINTLMQHFPDKIIRTTVKPLEVFPIMQECDYGIILRENNITNKVASPVKIAEYLACGLKVIISPNIGDYSKMVSDHDLGIVIDEKSDIELKKILIDERIRISNHAINSLTKSSINYKLLF